MKSGFYYSNRSWDDKGDRKPFFIGITDLFCL